MKLSQIHTRLFSTIYLVVVSFISFIQATHAQSFVFAKLDGAPLNTTGWNLQGAAYVGNTGTNTGNTELILVNPVNFSSGAAFFNTPINLAQCNKWIAEFEFRIAEGTAADGLAFCYLDVPPTGFVNGGGLGIPGTANGLKVCIDTWLNCGTDRVPKIQLRWGTGYNECTSEPTKNNNDGSLDFIRSGGYHRCTIVYDKGDIVVAINGVEQVKGFQNFNFTGYFGFTASTGGSTDRHSIKNVRIYTEMPPSDAGADRAFCSGETTMLGTPANVLYNYAWTPALGLSDPTLAQPSITLVNQGPLALQTRYYVRTSFKDIPGCASVDSVDLTVYPIPQISIETTTPCAGSLTQFAPKLNWDPAQSTNLNWHWTFGDPQAVPPGSDTAVGESVAHIYSSPGSYTAKLRLLTAQGCSTETRSPVQIEANPPVGFEVVNQGSACINGTLMLRNKAVLPVGTISRINPDFPAFSGNELAFTNLNPSETISLNYRLLGIQENKPGYQVVWTNESAVGCTSRVSEMVVFAQQPNLQSTPPQPLCSNGGKVELASASETSGLPGIGHYFGTGVDANGIGFDPLAAGVGNHPIGYAYAGSNGCSDTIGFIQQVNPSPAVDAGPNKVLLPGGVVVLNGSSSLPGSSVLWSPAAGLSNNNILQPNAAPVADQWYRLLVVAANECRGEDSVFVKVLPALNIPNAFSPNGDGVNDRWLIAGLDSYPESEVLIFDRYGTIVHRQTGYNQPWDGTLKGKPLPVATYYFLIRPGSGAKPVQGSITLLR